MKISSTQRVTGPASSKKTKATSKAKGFRVSTEAVDKAAAPTATAQVEGVNSVDALLALQGDEGVEGRHRRMMARANHLLDALEELKLALVTGQASPVILARIERLLQQKREDVEDPGLNSLLEQVEIRAEVEKAKLATSRAA